MKATVDGCKTATDMSIKTKHDKTDMLEPSKAKFKAPGKANKRCDTKLFSSPAEPSFLPIQSVTFTGKFKLQLFPIDGETKSILEQNDHNPYLELTVSAHKKISSVVKHLADKWIDIFTASTAEITLIPYNARSDNLVGVHRWTLSDTHITAADVYSVIGTPSVFRLRYGFLSNLETAPNERAPPQLEGNFHLKEVATDIHLLPFPDSTDSTAGAQQDNIPSKPAPPPSWLDSISNMSFGALLSTASPYLEEGNPSSQSKNLQVPQATFTCDSFDAAIGALIARQKSTSDHAAPPKATNNSSIWDAEETCHAFSVHKSAPFPRNEHAPCKDAPSKEVADLQVESTFRTDNAERKNMMMPPKEESNLLTKLDISLPEPVGPFENTVSCSRTPGGGADNVSFRELLSTSLDAFQNFVV